MELDVGERLRTLREMYGMSQRALAKLRHSRCDVGGGAGVRYQFQEAKVSRRIEKMGTQKARAECARQLEQA